MTGRADPTQGDDLVQARRAAMGLLARATLAELEAGLAAFDETGGAHEVRRPQTGLVMLRGRIGGTGAPFNLGEATVTRAAVRLPSGEVGHAYLLGRDAGRARLAALADALWQQPFARERLEAAILAPVRRRLEAQAAVQDARTAATKVDFFTLVRGED